MYFPSYRMCKMAIEELCIVSSFFYCPLSSIHVLRGFPCQPGQPCWASRVGPAVPGQAGEPGSPGTADPARLAQLARKPT